jgi:uncharacterized protein
VVAPREPITDRPSSAVDRPLLLMRWEQLTYVHWAVDPALVRAQLPDGLDVDVADDGAAYVGLVPFRMGGIAVQVGGRSVPLPQGTFPETNVRTYVIGPDGGRGVYFHSLDITRLAPTVVAQVGYRLPYAWSRMALGVRDHRWAYRTVRRWPAPAGASSHLVVEVGAVVPDVEVTDLDRFLSARWSLYAVSPRGRVLRAHVDHPPWPLRTARVVRLRDELVAAAGYPGLTGRPPDHVRVGGDVPVRVGPPRRVG